MPDLTSPDAYLSAPSLTTPNLASPYHGPPEPMLTSA